MRPTRRCGCASGSSPRRWRGDDRAASDDLLARWGTDFQGEPTSPFDEDAVPIAQALATGAE
jgi:hypothetical protein